MEAREGHVGDGETGRDRGGNVWTRDFHNASDGAVGGQLLKSLKNGFPFVWVGLGEVGLEHVTKYEQMLHVLPPLLGKVEDVPAFGGVKRVWWWYRPAVDRFDPIDPLFVCNAGQEFEQFPPVTDVWKRHLAANSGIVLPVGNLEFGTFFCVSWRNDEGVEILARKGPADSENWFGLQIV